MVWIRLCDKFNSYNLLVNSAVAIGLFDVIVAKNVFIE